MDEAENQRRRDQIRDLMPTTPYIKGLGLVIERFDVDDVLVRLPIRPELTNDGTQFHGGAVASLLDTAGALAAWSGHDFEKGYRASTVSMSVQYVGSSKGQDLVCGARAVRRGRELIFSEMTAWAAEENGALCAHGHLTYRIV